MQNVLGAYNSVAVRLVHAVCTQALTLDLGQVDARVECLHLIHADAALGHDVLHA